MKQTKRVLSVLLAVMMLIAVVPVGNVGITASAATFEDINQSSVFLKQQGSSTCTLVSAAMMMRRYAMLRGDSDWDSITEASLKPTAWLSGAGLYLSFTYKNISVNAKSLSADSSNTSKLISLLNEHPEGIVLYRHVSDSYQHAVLLTDYTDGVFYCADPLSSKPSGRIPVSNAYCVTITGATKYWYVTSPQVEIYEPDPIPPNPNDPAIDACYIDYSLSNQTTFRPNCIVDPSLVEIDHVRVAVWSEGSQSDLRWYDCIQGGPHGTIYYYDVPLSNHDSGAKSFICDFYVYGINGKSTTERISYNADADAPKIWNVSFKHVSGGFTVTCNVSDNTGISSVAFPTWTTNNGQDDLVWHEGSVSGNVASCTIKISDHNNEEGPYITHIYAYDTMGNSTRESTPYIYVGNFALDVNGYLDGTECGNLGSYGTFDIYFDGTQSRNDTNDYANLISCGTVFEIKDIKAKTGYTYNGVKSGVIKGTMNGSNIVVLNFTTNSSTLKVNPNGGTWNGSTATQSFKQKYNTTKSIPVPTRSGYTFTGWIRGGVNGKMSSTTAAATYTYGASNNVTDTITATWSCNHNYTSEVTTQPTCVAEGVRTYTCSQCGDSYTKPVEINPDNHVNTTNVAATASTCTVKGYTAGVYCNDCKKYISGHQEQPVNASNHVNTTNVAATASTCTVKGYTAGVYCNDCKKYISGHAEQPLAAHTITVINKRDATCTAEGYTGDQYCTVCKQTISTGTTIAKKAHTITVINKRDATYDADGYTGDEYCTVCQQTIKSGASIPKLTRPEEPTDPGTPDQPQQQSGGCKWCGKTHGGAFGWLVKIIHNILAAIFGAKY